MSWLIREPQHDPQLAAALRQMEGHSPLPDAEPLRQRIMADARPRLSAFRSVPPRWWEWISRWMPMAVPVGLAASLAAALLVPAGGEITTPRYTADAGADSTLMIAAFSEGSAGGQLTAHLVAPESGDWLLEQAVIQ